MSEKTNPLEGEKSSKTNNSASKKDTNTIRKRTIEKDGNKVWLMITASIAAGFALFLILN